MSTAAVPPVSERVTTQRLVSALPYDTVPEMLPPQKCILTPAPTGYARDLEMREDAPYFNASSYCNRMRLRFSLWLRHPATIALIRAFNSYYREAAHESSPALVMQVKSGPRIVHGYYVHIMLHDALSAWCDFEAVPLAERRRLPTAPRVNTTFVYTTRTVIQPGTPPDMVAAAQLASRERIANVISAARGGTLVSNA